MNRSVFFFSDFFYTRLSELWGHGNLFELRGGGGSLDGISVASLVFGWVNGDMPDLFMTEGG